MSQRDDVLVWMDMEMTGLDPDTCVVIQVAVILTDHNLNEIAGPLDLTVWQPDAVLDTMSPFVHAMHEKNGLLEQVRQSEVDLVEAEQQIMELLAKHSTYRTGRLCGNSITQDRRFLFKYMPAVESYMHYRQVDVSTLKELALWWYGRKFQKPKEGNHTALHDIQQSIEEMKFYREHILQ